MGLEVILSEIGRKGDHVLLSFRNSEHLGSCYVEGWQHKHTFKPLSEEQKQGIIETTKKNTDPEAVRIQEFSRIPKYNAIQVEGPFMMSEMWPKELKTGGYLEQLRRRLSPEGAIWEVEEEVIECMKKTRDMNKQLDELRTKIEKENPETSKAQQTRILNSIIEGKRKGAENIIEQWKELEQRSGKINSRVEYDKKKKRFNMIIGSIDRFRYERMMDMDELMKQKWLMMDIEVPLYNTDNPQVSWVGMIYYQEGSRPIKEMHTLHSLGTERFEGYKIFTHKTQEELVKGVRDSIQRQDPYAVCAYNAKYDLLKLRKGTRIEGKSIVEEELEFEIGARHTKPVIKCAQQFFERIKIAGRMVFDWLPWAKIVYKNLQNRKLDLVAKEILGREAFSKSKTYEELRDLEERCMDEASQLEERQAAAREIAKYLCGDVDVMLKIKKSKKFQQATKAFVELSQIYKIGLDILIHSTNGINKAQDRKYWEKVGLERQKKYQNHKRQGKYETNAKTRLKTLLRRHLGMKGETGVFEKVTQAYMPIYHHLQRFVGEKERFPEISKLTETINREKLSRFVKSQMADSLCQLLTISFMDCKEAERQARTAKRKAEKSWKKATTDYTFRKGCAEQIKKSFKEINQERKKQGKRLEEIAEKATRRIKTILEESIIEKRGDYDLAGCAEAIVKRNITKNKRYAIRQTMKEVFRTTPEEIDKELQKGLGELRRQLQTKRARLIRQDGQILYLQGNINGIEGLIPLQRIDKAVNGPAIHYYEHGYLKGFKKERKPTNNMMIYERDGLKTFIDLLLQGKNKEAIEHLKRQYDKLENWEQDPGFMDKHPITEFYTMAKSTGRHISYENQQKTCFFQDEHTANMESGETPRIDKKGRRYVFMDYEGKKTKHYIMRPEELEIDMGFIKAVVIWPKFRDYMTAIFGITAGQLFTQETDNEWIDYVSKGKGQLRLPI